MSTELNSWLGRVSKRKAGDDCQRDKTVGTGFITIFPWFVTCNHVLTSCIDGKKSTDQVDPGLCETILIDFPFHPELHGKLFTVSVVMSKRLKRDREYTTIEDIAILQLHQDDNDSELFEGWTSRWLYEKRAGSHTDLNVVSKGFHLEEGDELRGRTTTDRVDGRITVEFENSESESIEGASGAPVWSTKGQEIIGMLVSQRGENADKFVYKRAHMIPMYKVIDACEQHRQALLEDKEDRLNFEPGNYGEFRDNAKYELSQLLSSKPMQILQEGFLRKQRWGNKEELSSQELTDKLLEECPKNTSKIFRNLSTSTRDCLKKFDREERYKEAKSLIDDVEKVVAILSLYSVKFDDAEKLRQNVMYSTSSLHLAVKHDSLSSAELISATRMQAIPRYKKHDKRPLVQGRYAVSHVDLENGIGKHGSWIDDIGKQVWKTFFHGYDESSYNRRDLCDHIRRELGADDAEKKNCYLVVLVNPQDKNESPLLDAKRRGEFSAVFPTLPIILLNGNDESGVYISSDRDLMVELYKFYEVIEKYDTKTTTNLIG